MDNRVFINSAGLIEIQVVGDQTVETVRQMGEEVARLIAFLQSNNLPVRLLDNLVRLGRADGAARNEVALLARALSFDRCAMLGLSNNPIMRHGTNYMLQAIGKPNIRYFASRDAAYIWLGIEPDNLS